MKSLDYREPGMLRTGINISCGVLILELLSEKPDRFSRWCRSKKDR